MTDDDKDEYQRYADENRRLRAERRRLRWRTKTLEIETRFLKWMHRYLVYQWIQVIRDIALFVAILILFALLAIEAGGAR